MTSASEPEASLQTIAPTSQPITLLQTQPARIFIHVHPILLLGYYYSRFPALTIDPISTLWSDLLPIALLQIAYAVICLPAARGPSNPLLTSKSTSKASAPKRLLPLRQRNVPDVFTAATAAFLGLVLTAVISAPLLATIMVLLGAPFTTHHAQTYLCACHMALLAGFPLFYVYGLFNPVWREISGALHPFDGVWGGTVGCGFGAWLGAIPIPLDWDREWQKWPITIVTGAYLGYVVGKLGGEYLLRGKRIKFDERDALFRP